MIPSEKKKKTQVYSFHLEERVKGYETTTLAWGLDLVLAGEKVALHSKHLSGSGGHETVDLSRVLLYLAGVEHALESTGLLGKLEQSLPLILGQEWLLELGAGGILCLPLGLPGVNLGLLTGKRSLVVLEVVVLGVMSVDGFKKQVAILLEEWVDVEGKVVEVGSKDGGGRKGAGGQGGQGWRKVEIFGGRRRWELVKVGCEEVGVVNLNGEFNEDILVSETGLLEPVHRPVSQIPP